MPRQHKAWPECQAAAGGSVTSFAALLYQRARQNWLFPHAESSAPAGLES